MLRGQKWVFDPLELELQVAVSCPMRLQCSHYPGVSLRPPFPWVTQSSHLFLTVPTSEQRLEVTLLAGEVFHTLTINSYKGQQRMAATLALALLGLNGYSQWNADLVALSGSVCCSCVVICMALYCKAFQPLVKPWTLSDFVIINKIETYNLIFLF